MHPNGPAKKLLAKTGELLGGLLIFWVCLTVGTQLKAALKLMVPGNVLGLFLLLGLISIRVVKLRHIEFASKWLRFFMPLLFVPIYVGAGEDKAIWAKWGWLLVPSLVAAVTAIWVFVGHLAQRLGRRGTESATEFQPITGPGRKIDYGAGRLRDFQGERRDSRIDRDRGDWSRLSGQGGRAEEVG